MDSPFNRDKDDNEFCNVKTKTTLDRIKMTILYAKATFKKDDIGKNQDDFITNNIISN